MHLGVTLPVFGVAEHGVPDSSEHWTPPFSLKVAPAAEDSRDDGSLVAGDGATSVYLNVFRPNSLRRRWLSRT